MKEIWKDIPGYVGFYQASNKGRIRSLDFYVPCGRGGAGWRLVKGRVLRPGGRKPSGHMTVALGKGNSQGVHCLVLLAFVGKPKRGQEGLHLNHKPSDNRLSNLKWGSRSENMKMDYAAGTRKHNPNWNRWGYRYD